MKSAAAVFIDLYRVRKSVLDAWLNTLSPSSRKRAGNIKSARRYRQFIASRWVLGTLIEERTGILPRIVEGAERKPEIANMDIYCNISHSGDAVMAGYSLEAPIGVDIEQHRQRDFERLAKAYFHPLELQALAEIDEEYIPDLFYRTWTLKEAHAKATGHGLTLQYLAQPVDESPQTEYAETHLIGEYTASVVHYSPKRIVTKLLAVQQEDILRWQTLHSDYPCTNSKSLAG